MSSLGYARITWQLIKRATRVESNPRICLASKIIKGLGYIMRRLCGVVISIHPLIAHVLLPFIIWFLDLLLRFSEGCSSHISERQPWVNLHRTIQMLLLCISSYIGRAGHLDCRWKAGKWPLEPWALIINQPTWQKCSLNEYLLLVRASSINSTPIVFFFLLFFWGIYEN